MPFSPTGGNARLTLHDREEGEEERGKERTADRPAPEKEEQVPQDDPGPVRGQGRE